MSFARTSSYTLKWPRLPAVRSGQVAEDHLRAFGRRGFFPDAVHVGHRLVDLGSRVVGHVRHHEPQIERGLAALAGDLEHVVLARIDAAVLDVLRAGDEVFDEALQLRAGRGTDGHGPALFELGHGQFEHLGRAHVGHLPELAHEFGHVDEAREAGLEAVAFSIGTEFHGT